MKTLLLGAGSNKEKKLAPDGLFEWSGEVITLDNNIAHGPDMMHDLNEPVMPFGDDTFDEIHAYDVLEHLGALGDYEFFFNEFEEYHRILKPGGLFCAIVPPITSPWLFGDPSHTRVICAETLTVLSQKCYEEQVGITAMSDFRSIYHADFETIALKQEENRLSFVLRAIKE